MTLFAAMLNQADQDMPFLTPHSSANFPRLIAPLGSAAGLRTRKLLNPVLPFLHLGFLVRSGKNSTQASLAK